MKPQANPILVTGAHRTGTTWVGKMLTASGEAAYISEPLNVWHRPGVMRAPVSHWYTYICQENEMVFLPALLETCAFKYHLWLELKALRSTKDIGRMLRDSSIFLGGRLRQKRALLKDPFAVLSIPWFIERLGCQVVVTVRHPAAFASSLKRLDWPFDFSDFLEQSLLQRDVLEKHLPAIQAVLETPQDLLAQGSLLWQIIYEFIQDCQMRYSPAQLLIVRHEDLSLNPVDGFLRLYESLGLTYSPQVEQAILGMSSTENPQELSRKKVHATRLDSRANLTNWKRRLTPEEIERIKHLTASATTHFYPDFPWD